MEIAVIGIAGRFPSLKNPAELWECLVQGKESLSFYTEEELVGQGLDPDQVAQPDYVKVNGFVPDKDGFDPAFFGYTPKEAEVMAPQVRLLHECVWEALEDAGYNPFDYKEPVGLYAGTSSSVYWENLTYLSGKDEELGSFEAEHLNNKDCACTKVAYNLNLKGPVVALHTECSTSLVAIHQASRSLLTGECKMALAGGIALSYQTKGGYQHQPGMIKSSDGHCRAFDEKADGTVLTEGGGIVVLKRLTDAIADGDHIYAVIKGSAVNNDGFRKVGFTAPSVEGQAEVIRMAHRMARVSAESICFVEAHGTGTNLGDPIEVDALKLAFSTPKKNFCALGSVKSNIGHLGEGAGIAGLIKAALALKHGVLPATLHFEQPNTKVDFAKSPFYVNTTLQKLEPSAGTPLRAGVSSFGIGGTNAHVVLEAYRQDPPAIPAREFEWLPLSAASAAGLDRQLAALQQYCNKHPGADVSRIGYTLQLGRKHLPFRACVVCDQYGSEVVNDIEAARGAVQPGPRYGDQVVFMFPGQGCQYANIARGLYEGVAPFREEVDCCLAIAGQFGRGDLKTHLFPAAPDQAGRIDHTEITQPALFIIEYALARLLIRSGISPRAMIGHSLGEYVAACLAGVFSLEDALRLVCARGRAVAAAPAGSMLSVGLSEEDLLDVLPEGLSVAAVNSPQSCVVSGHADLITAFRSQLQANGVPCRVLATSHAFHSVLMDEISGEFEAALAGVKLHPPTLPFVSNLTGDWAEAAQVVRPAYWLKQLRHAVRFKEGLLTLGEGQLFIEVGPGKALSSFLRQTCREEAVTTLRHPNDAVHDKFRFYQAIARLWEKGLTIDWSALQEGGTRQKISLPTYPFERQKYWLDDRLIRSGAQALLRDQAVKQPLDQWGYLPVWKREYIQLEAYTQAEDTLAAAGSVLLLGDEGVLTAALRERLERKGVAVTTVVAAEATPAGSAPGAFRIRAGEAGEYAALVHDLAAGGKLPQRILHLWSAGSTGAGAYTYDRFLAEQTPGLYSLLYLSQAIREYSTSAAVRVLVVTTGQHQVNVDDTPAPGPATLQAAIKVIPQEFPEIRLKQLDFSGLHAAADHLNVVEEELFNDYSRPAVAFRNGFRWVETFDQAHLTGKYGEQARLRTGGTYLITGGLGGIGLLMARYLARHFAAKLVLVGRTQLPPRPAWEALAAQAGDPVGRKIKKVLEIEALGGQVLVLRADVGDPAQINQALHEARQAFGPVHGVIHAAADTAGPSHAAPAETMTAAAVEEQCYAKVKGLLVLDEATGEAIPDFVMITSSLSAVLGGIGFLAYAASNIFADQYAAYQNGRGRGRWISVNWDGWEEEEAPRTGPESFILPAEGMEAFRRILGFPFNQRVVVSTRDLDARIEKWIRRSSLPETEAAGGAASPLPAADRPRLSTAYVAPENETEAALVKLWGKMFGIGQLGTEDNFFEIGGDSLRIVTLCAKIHKALGVKVSVEAVFNHPTIRQLAPVLTGLDRKAFAEIPPAPARESYPLSSAQKRIFIIQNLDQDNVAYNIPKCFEIRERVDQPRLEKALAELLRRHESLRTVFVLEEGVPVQKVLPGGSIPVVQYEEAKDGSLEAVQHRFVRPFDLSVFPLMRVALYTAGNGKQYFLQDIHHIISDGISDGIIMDDLAALYQGQQLPALKTRYADFSAWQSSPEQQQQISRQKEFWVQQFRDETPVLNLPGDYQRATVKSFAGDTVFFTLSPETAEKLRALAGSQGATLYMVMLAAFNVFLSKISQQEDIVVGAPVAGRRHTGLRQVVGIFINILALRNFPHGGLSFLEFLADVRRRTIAAFENQDYQFEDLVEAVVQTRDTSRNPLFDVMFDYHNEDAKTNGKARPSFAAADAFDEMGKGTSMFDLNLHVYERGALLKCELDYSTTLFRRDTPVRFAAYFQETLEAILRAPESTIADVSVLPPAEKRDVIYAFNDTGTAFDDHLTMHQLFEQQVLKRPEAVAVSARGRDYSYREINRSANQLAHCLRAAGVTRNVLVGVFMDRTEQMLIAVMAVLKAGGAYVPFDHALPPARVARMLHAARLGTLITDANQVNQVYEIAESAPGLRQVFVAGGETSRLYHARVRFCGADCIAGCPDTNPESVNNPADVAYVIHTSGSTGTPKGVVETHRPAVNLIQWVNKTFAVGPGDKLLFVTSLGFDLSVYDIFGVLAAGGCVRVASNEEVRDPMQLLTILKREDITFWDSAPAALQQLVPLLELHVGKDCRTALRLVFQSGDWIPLHSPKVLKTHFPGVEVISLGGATEATVWSNYYPVGQLDPAWLSIPYGKPIQNARYYVLDERLQPLSVGVPGDLYIGGPCLSSGYLNSPELTAGKFLPNPFVANDVIYKTGDLARWYPDGNLEFLGRKDAQVKIRGHRIELGEIEARLGEYPGIKAVAVEAKGATKTSKYLCAYYLADEPLSGSELKSFLSRELPAYMVPGYFIRLESFPVTRNGKLDRKALPEPAPEAENSTDGAAGSAHEAVLIGLWEKILGKTALGVQSNFFHLGGDSIKAIQVIAGLQKQDLDVELRHIFQYPTIRELALCLRQKTFTASQAPVADEYGLSPIQQWFFESDYPDKHYFNQGVLLRGVTRLRKEIVEKAVRALVAHHDALRTVYAPAPAGAVTARGQLPGEETVAFYHWETGEADRAEAFIAEKCGELQASFSLPEGPLFKTAHFSAPDADYLFILAHHLVIDGYSWRILFEDFTSLYRQLENGRGPVSLPLKTTAYKDWVGKLRQHAAGAWVDEEIGYWKEVGRDVKPLASYFAATGSPAGGKSREAYLNLSEQHTQRLLNEANQAYGTEINDILIAAVALAVNAWTGAPKFLIEMEGHGREETAGEVNLSRTVGWCTALYPLEVEVDTQDPESLVQSVRQRLRTVPGRGANYGVIRYLSGKGAQVTHCPADISFNYLGQFDQDIDRYLFEPADIAVGEMTSSAHASPYTLEVNGLINGNRLCFTLGFAAAVINPAQAEAFVALLEESLVRIIDHATAPALAGQPAAEAELDDILLELNG